MNTMPFTINEVCGLIGVSVPSYRASFEVPCPSCGGKRLNINVAKEVFKCMRCGSGGGMTHLYSVFTGTPVEESYNEILDRLGRGKGDSKWDGKRLIVQPKAKIEFPEGCELAPLDVRADTNQALIDQLALADDHIENLHRRGFYDEEIEWLEYRSYPTSSYQAIVESLQMQGCQLAGVPGLFKKKSGQWTIVYSPRGIMIPVRDIDGRVQGFTTRLDHVEKSSRKFKMFSSIYKESGTGALGWAHFAGVWEDGMDEIILTEGPMKADMSFLITRIPTIAIPGVNTIAEAMKMLDKLKKRGLKKVRIALDMDYTDKKIEIVDGVEEEKESQVYLAYRKLIENIVEHGLVYTRMVWPRQYKGIDDFLAAMYRGVK